MDYSYQGRHSPPQLAVMLAQSNAILDDQCDSGANAHITKELENLTIQQLFQSADKVAIGNGDGLQIKNIDSSTFYSTNPLFALNFFFHCPYATANFLSIHKFCSGNLLFYTCYFPFFCQGQSNSRNSLER